MDGRGLSELAAALAMAAVAVVLIIIVTSTGLTSISKYSGSPSISASVEAVRVSANAYAISIDLANLGDGAVTIQSIELKGATCSYTSQFSIKAKQSRHISLTCSIPPGSYVLLVRGVSERGEALAWEFPVNVA